MLRLNHPSEDHYSSDEEIWLKLIEGDRSALETLFHRHYERLFQYALKMSGRREMAEDCIQDLFLKIWQRRNRLSREVKGVKTYLWTALRRELVGALKSRRRHRQWVEQRRSKSHPNMHLSPEEVIVKNELDIHIERHLKNAISQLSPRQREVLYLKFYEGMSYDEIEQIISISYQTARNHVSKALKVMRVFMKGAAQQI